MKKVLFSATVDSHILAFHLPFLKWFKEQGYEVHVATNGDAEIPYCDKKIKISFERSPFKLNNIKAIFQLKKVISKEKYDIIHTHTPMGSVVTRLAAKGARKHGTRVIYTAHGFHFFKGAPLLNWVLFYPVEKYLSKYTDTLILINKEDYNLAKKKFKKCRDIQYVPGVGIDENKFNIKMTKKDKHELRESLDLKDSDFVMIYPAELSNRKRQIWLINTISTLLKENKDIHLLLPGKDSLNGQCQKLVRELNLEDQIHFLGFRRDIPKLLKISDLSVSSSRQEGLPVNIMEAMYVGLPIVASDCRGNRDLVKNGENGYIVSLDDSETFRDRIKIVKNNYDKKKYKKCNRNLIKPYKLKEIFLRLEEIYTFNSKKTIIHFLSSNIFSGAENVVSKIIDATCKDDWNVYYCSPLGLVKDIIVSKNIQYIPLKKLNIKEIKKVIKKYNPAILHAHDFKASCLISRFKINGNFVISEIHQNPNWIGKKNLRSLFYSYCSQNFDKIVVVSPSLEKSLKKIVNNDIQIINNIVDSKNVILKSKEKTNGEKFQIMFCGRLTEEKRPLLFIDMIGQVKKYYPEIHAIMIGDGPLFDECKSKIKNERLEKNIELVGFQENPYKFFRCSKINVITSKNEGFGLVAVEGFVLGKPAICFNVNGLNEIVIPGTGYICYDVNDMVGKIINLLNDKKEYEKLSKNAKKHSFEYTNLIAWNNIINKLYQEAMKEI